MRVWFDRIGGMAPSNPEHTESVEASARQLSELIDDAVQNRGIDASNIALGGFSMGGSIAIQTALRTRHRLGAVFALSSYLCDDSWAWAELFRETRRTTFVDAGAGPREVAPTPSPFAAGRTPLLMAHGDRDGFVRPEWGRATAKRMKELGVPTTFVPVRDAAHELTKEELSALFAWLSEELHLSGELAPSL